MGLALLAALCPLPEGEGLRGSENLARTATKYRFVYKT
jgi:hypothetical protein